MLQKSLALTAAWLTGDREAMKLQARAARNHLQPSSTDPASVLIPVYLRFQKHCWDPISTFKRSHYWTALDKGLTRNCQGFAIDVIGAPGACSRCRQTGTPTLSRIGSNNRCQSYYYSGLFKEQKIVLVDLELARFPDLRYLKAVVDPTVHGFFPISSNQVSP